MTEVEHLNRHHEANARTTFGFWVYLMTDCVLFASLFATFLVLRNSTFGGPPGSELFSLPFVLTETLVLLTSSFTVGLGLLAARRRDLRQVQLFFGITMMLGILFLALEISEFYKLYSEGNSWTRSGFLSAFFTLVGIHGLHITSGLIWMAVMLVRTARSGLTSINVRRLTLLSIFWHFLDIIWIFIFTVVYLMGAAI